MKETLKKQHYKFTIYHLETYYLTDCKKKKLWGDGGYYYEKRTWVNQSNYKEMFSLHFHDENQLKKFLKDRHKEHYSIGFFTNLGAAIKSKNLDNAKDWVTIISTSTSEDFLNFQLRKPNKVNKFLQKRHRKYHDYYRSSYNWLANEIKRKKIDEFITDINDYVL